MCGHTQNGGDGVPARRARLVGGRAVSWECEKLDKIEERQGVAI